MTFIPGAIPFHTPQTPNHTLPRPAAPSAAPQAHTASTQRAFDPTDEQLAFVEAFKAGKNIVGQAVAGSGKTSTLALIDEVLPELGARGYYLAFNKKIVTDVQGKLNNVTVKTFHSVAYRIVMGSQYRMLMSKLNNPKAITRYGTAAYKLGFTTPFTYVTTKKLAVNQARLHASDDDNIAQTYKKYIEKCRKNNIVPSGTDTVTVQDFHELSAAAMFGEAVRALELWCQSDAYEFDTSFIEIPRNLLGTAYEDTFVDRIAEIARDLWDNDICNPNGIYVFKHDYYLKLAFLLRPNFINALNLHEGDVILFDEAQDARPCMAKMVEDQMQYGLRVITVGDSNQAIYQTFTGARDALPRFSSMDNTETLTLSTSWRFGEDIAAWANHILNILETNPVEVHGNPNKMSKVVVYDGKDASQNTTRVDMDQDALYFDETLCASLNMPQTTTTYSSTPQVDAYLVRSNGELVEVAQSMFQSGIRYALETDTREIFKAIDAYTKILFGEAVSEAVFREFTDYDDMMEYATNERTRSEPLATLIRNIDRFTPQVMRDVVNAAEKAPKSAEVVISTAHKAKGLEWDTVALYGNETNFVPFMESQFDLREAYDLTTRQFVSEEAKEAFMLLYVAITRAKRTLYIPARIVSGLIVWKKYLNGAYPPDSVIIQGVGAE